jgi:hypothetical protein
MPFLNRDSVTVMPTHAHIGGKTALSRNFIMIYMASVVSDAVSDHSISFFFSSSFEGR